MNTRTVSVFGWKLLAALSISCGPVIGTVHASPGDLLVSSALGDNVLQYDGQTGAFIDIFATGGGLDHTAGLAIGPDGHLYVSSGGTSSILRYNGQTGAFIDVFASGGGLTGPAAVTFGRCGDL